MNNQNETTGLIENRNIDLWNKLSFVQDIRTQMELRNDYMGYSENNKL